VHGFGPRHDARGSVRRALVSPPRQWRARANLAGADQSEVSATTPTACSSVSSERAGSRGAVRPGAAHHDGHAAANPRLVAAVLAAASSDWAAQLIAHSLQDIAAALLVEEAEAQRILPAHELLRPRP
jgi:hypothetical protein